MKQRTSPGLWLLILIIVMVLLAVFLEVVKADDVHILQEPGDIDTIGGIGCHFVPTRNGDDSLQFDCVADDRPTDDLQDVYFVYPGDTVWILCNGIGDYIQPVTNKIWAWCEEGYPVPPTSVPDPTPTATPQPPIFCDGCTWFPLIISCPVGVPCPEVQYDKR